MSTTVYNQRIYCITEGAWVYLLTTSAAPLTTCPNNVAHTVNAGSPSIASVAYADATASVLYGNGADGDTTISVNTTLARDMYYQNLTVNVGIVLSTGGFRIFVKNTLTLAGMIRNIGANSGGRPAAPGRPRSRSAAAPSAVRAARPLARPARPAAGLAPAARARRAAPAARAPARAARVAP
jgi:hypothetical protein